MCSANGRVVSVDAESNTAGSVANATDTRRSRPGSDGPNSAPAKAVNTMGRPAAPKRTVAAATGHVIPNAVVANTTISASTTPTPAPNAAPRSAPRPRRLLSSLIAAQSTFQARTWLLRHGPPHSSPPHTASSLLLH